MALDDYREVMTDALGMLDMGLSYATMYFSKSDSAFEQLNLKISQFVANQGKATTDQYAFANQTSKENTIWMLALLALSLTTSAVLTVYFRRHLLRSLKFLRQLAVQMQAGDLRSRVQVGSEDEIGVVIHEFNRMLDKMQSIIGGIKRAVSESNDAVSVLKDKSEQVQTGANEQAKQSSLAASIVEKLARGFKDTNDTSHRAETISRNSEKVCGDAVAQMTIVQTGITDLDTTIERSAQSIAELGDRSREIQGITQIIEGIASQTNLLALNAAIEAARAGESGRGFAVVADQVRKLADQTADATSQIADLVKGVMRGTESAVLSMKRGTEETSELSAKFAHMTALIEGLKVESTSVRELSEKTANQVDAQQEGVRAIAEHIAKIASLANKNSNFSQQSRCESEKVGNLAQDLESSIKSFVL